MSEKPYFTNRYIDQPLTPLQYRSPMMRAALVRDVSDRLLGGLRDPETLEALARVKVKAHAYAFENPRYAEACKAHNSILLISPVRDAAGNVPEAFTQMTEMLDAVTEEGQFHRIYPALAGGYEGDVAYGAKDGMALLAAVEKALGPVQSRMADSADKYFEPAERIQGRTR
jgi:hypothetical protein